MTPALRLRPFKIPFGALLFRLIRVSGMTTKLLTFSFDWFIVGHQSKRIFSCR